MLDSALTGKAWCRHAQNRHWTNELCLNAKKSSNYATPKWNNHIYLISNIVENNTHMSTLHSMIRKQLSKIGQSTEWHFNTQTCRCSNPTRTSRPDACQAHKPPTSSSGFRSSAATILNLTQLTRIITLISIHAPFCSVLNLSVRLTSWVIFSTHWGRDKWPPVSRQHFLRHFREWKLWT